eukprot:TRINITY_DN214_c0_g1_i2.p1 TRINITY_DN214_c0_g1~~TRINITY_DN214_c0_g1_i2.p1  ORF type:complete len:296 (+),score=37.50 TRINITY_DN214_c0_g1_i2:41-889(+)
MDGGKHLYTPGGQHPIHVRAHSPGRQSQFPQGDHRRDSLMVTPPSPVRQSSGRRMSGVQGVVHGPVDLSCLDPLDSVYIKQQVEMLEALTGIETQNKYKVFAKTSPNAPLMFAAEDSTFCARNCLGKKRPFSMMITSPSTSQLLLKLTRPYTCCLSELIVTDERDTQLGKIQEQCVCCSRIFYGFDAQGTHIFEIFGPCCSPWTFYVRRPRNADGSEGQSIGTIRKKWSGILKEMLTDADNFGCDFEPSLPRHHKALILAAVFLIDFVYFEDSNNRGAAGAF